LALGADVGAALLPGVTGAGMAVRAGERAVEAGVHAGEIASKGAELLLDTNVVISDGKKLVEAGANVVKAEITNKEIKYLVKSGRMRGHKAAEAISTVANGSNVHTRINVRAGLTAKKTGNFADGVIGATAIERNSTLVTRDKALSNAVKKAGGRVKHPDEIL